MNRFLLKQRVLSMAFDSLIPFALNPETGLLVDVASVPRGKACGCVCPSCQTPLVACHGEIKEWYFAHRSRNVHQATQDRCKYSFAVSIRMMIRQLAQQGLSLKTPALSGDVSAYDRISYKSKKFPYEVTSERDVLISTVEIGAVFKGVQVDVLASIGRYKLVIYVTYKDRRVPDPLKELTESDYGVLEINATHLITLYKEEKYGRYTSVLQNFLTNNTVGKKWVYHPNEMSQKSEAEKSRDAWVKKQNHSFSADHTDDSSFLFDSDTSGLDIYDSVVFDPHFDFSLDRLKTHLCDRCGFKWCSASSFCERCGSDQYSKVIE